MKTEIQIELPSIEQQQRFIFEAATKAAMQQLEQNLKAPIIKDLELDESLYSRDHLLTEERWQAPHPDIVRAYLEQFQRHTEHKTDKALAAWLGLKGTNAERRLRAYKTGSEVPPFGIWRKLLVATGRVPQEIMSVVAFMR
jgi:hypothetical protein